MLLRAAVSVVDAELQRRLLARLRKLAVWSDPVDLHAVEPATLAEAYDLVLVGPGIAPSQVAAVLEAVPEDELAPLVVRLYREADPEAQAQLFARGLAQAIYVDVDDQALEAALEHVIDRRTRELRTLLGQDDSRPELRDFRSFDPQVRALREQARAAARTDSTILLHGETGSGKEWLAQAIHGASHRADGPFVPVNCGALNETLLESELFGHEKGAFTGADHIRRGHFELAHGGTLFLDEIGEIPLHLQSRLLRVLEDKRVQRLGSERSVRVDVRIIAATHRDLADAVAQGTFRADLYFRLRVVSLQLPPLRKRRADIPSFVRYHCLAAARRLGVTDGGVQQDALDALTAYDWPGNIRELANVIERAVILRRGPSIGLDDLPVEVAAAGAPPLPTGPAPQDAAPSSPSTDDVLALVEDWDRPWKDIRQEVLEAAERAYLMRLLARCGGRIGVAAKQAGLSERGLFEKLRRHGLSKESFRLRSG